MGSDDDAERQVKRAACADELTRALQVGSRVDEEPGVLLPVAEEPELIEPPADDALVLEGQLERRKW